MSENMLTIALLQMDIAIGEPDANFAKLARMMEEAVRTDPKPDVLVFPEMWNTGYALDRIRDIADRDGERTAAFIADFCRKHAVHIVAGSVAEAGTRHVRSSTVVLWAPTRTGYSTFRASTGTNFAAAPVV